MLSPGGSSSGAGTAASFWAANVGSDTGGSIINPSNQSMLVGFRPTLGRISRYGVIPITADHDTAGPMTRTVTDAAILMGVLESASPDPKDDTTKICTPPPGHDYTKFLKPGALKGARIGIPRTFYYDRAAGGGRGRGGLNAEQNKSMSDAIEVLKKEGAIVVDPAEIPSFVATDPKNNFPLWPYCSGANQGKGHDEDCSVNFKYGMKRDFNAWLATLGPSAPVKTLTELRQWNLKHEKAGAIRYGQARIDISDEMDVEADRARNDADVRKDNRLSRAEGIDAVLFLEEHRLDAILTPRWRKWRGFWRRARVIRLLSCRSAWCRSIRSSSRFLQDLMRCRRHSASDSRARHAVSRGCSKSPTASNRPPSVGCARRICRDHHVNTQDSGCNAGFCVARRSSRVQTLVNDL